MAGGLAHETSPREDGAGVCVAGPRQLGYERVAGAGVVAAGGLVASYMGTGHAQ